MYLPIPSAQNKYEIDTRGNVRNAHTKYVLKSSLQNQTPVVHLFIDGKSIARSVRQLLWEVHGIKPTRLHLSPIPVWLFKDGEILYFECMKKAALFLSMKLFYTVKTIVNVMIKRQPEFKGWKIKYCEEEKRIYRSTDQIIGSKYLRRENKYWRENV